MSWYSDGEKPSKWYLIQSGDADADTDTEDDESEVANDEAL